VIADLVERAPSLHQQPGRRLRAVADRSARSLRHGSVGPAPQAPQSQQGGRNDWSPRLSARLLSEPLFRPLPLNFRLDPDHEAHRPPEADGGRRDDVRLLLSPGDDDPVHTWFAYLPDHLQAGDLVVVNNSGTVGAAIDVTIAADEPHGAFPIDAVLHVSSPLPGDLWMVEPRTKLPNGSTRPLALPDHQLVAHQTGGRDRRLFHLLRPAPDSARLWMAVAADGINVAGTLRSAGRPIRYSYVSDDWPLAAYQTVFSEEPGSAEMPSAARPFTADVVTRLVSRGVGVAPITLHTGVSSLEGDERPYAERFRVPAATAAAVNTTHLGGGHVIAIGTTVVRTLETVTDERGVTHPGQGWTDVVITPERGVRAVDGLLTGWHEPEASHLAMLEAVAGRGPLVTAYESAFANGYRWHEFGDSHLILPYAGQR